MADDDALEELQRARPPQTDLVARKLEARVRETLLGIPAEPTRLDRFVVLDRLGSGAMGIVYAAYDPKLDRRVALKVVRAEGSAARDRVLAEARALARLSHPNVVAVHDAAEVGDDLYIAMELVPGGNLRSWLATDTHAID